MRISTKLLLLVMSSILVLVGLCAILTLRGNDRLIQLQARRTAQTVANQVLAERKYYVQLVASKLERTSWSAREGESSAHIPLPATFVMHIASDVSSSQKEYKYGLVSRWNINPANSLSDGFLQRGFANLMGQEKQAKADRHLSADKAFKDWKPYFEVTTADGRPALRYMVADVAAGSSCVSCHNSLELRKNIITARANDHVEQARSYQLNDLMGAVSVTVKLDEVGAISRSITMGTLAWLFLAGLVTTLLTIWFVRGTIAAPMRSIVERMKSIATGNTEQNLSFKSSDEIGELAQSFRDLTAYNRTVASACEALGRGDLTVTIEPRSDKDLVAHSFRGLVAYNRTIAAACEAIGRGDLTVAIEPRSDKDLVATNFTQAIASMRGTVREMADSAASLASASEELAATASQMSSNAQETAAQAGAVSAAAEQISTNMQTVASGAEEMTASIREIARNAHDAAKVAGEGVKVTQVANEKVNKLGESSQEIGKVIKVINSIAEQTHLLALNATIEAARAGEAGKGFAVVANEVKELAKETAKATEDISRRIEAIQNNTKGAVESITEITGIIFRISDTQSTIAVAVEEQTATTNEICRNVSEVATGNQEIARNVCGVTQAAKSTTEGADYTSKAAGELARLAVGLHALVEQFTYAGDGQQGSGTTVTAKIQSTLTVPPPNGNGHKSTREALAIH